jgi:N-acetylmuramoyl-L-alanine amidase
MIAESMIESVKEIGCLHTGVGQAPFWVLNGAFMPSVLVETAFMSNPREEKLLADKKFQQKAGEAIFGAIMKFKEKYEAGL